MWESGFIGRLQEESDLNAWGFCRALAPLGLVTVHSSLLGFYVAPTV